MTFLKSTKNTHVFEDKTDLAPVPTLYIKRDSMPKDVPQRIRVTIEME